ncbi:MAG: PrsW family glutamic-type intramembrane protease, partial [Eubacterium sp.]
AAEINSLLALIFSEDIFFLTTSVTPISEEIIKALPILFFSFIYSDDRKTILSISMAVGIGFAILENATILTQNIDSVNVTWAIVRGFCAALMHGICTAAVGYGVSFVKKKKKLFYTGTFGLLTTAIIFHATYNALVQSTCPYIGFILPILVYIPIVILIKKQSKKEKIISEQ